MRVICQLLVIPRVRNLGPDKSNRLFQAVRKFGKTMTGIMKKYTDLCLHFRLNTSEHVHKMVHEPEFEEHFSVM